MKNVEQLEREAEEIRAQISTTSDELRARIAPSALVEQLVDYASNSGGAEYLHNLRRQVVNNPMPVVVMGASLAWLALSSRGGLNGGSSVSSSGMGNLRSAGTSAADAISNAAHSVSDSAHSAAASASDTVSGIAQSASETYEAAADRAIRAADQLRASASGVRDNLSETTRSVMSYLNEQPLLLAGLGIAIGAALGAALPSSQTENDLMGETSDRLKEGAAETLAHTGQKVSETFSGAEPGELFDAQGGRPGEEAPLVPLQGEPINRELEATERKGY
jgi:ElaB/YqjD/DUF883 family membrane-anchored ribosome-binding protein